MGLLWYTYGDSTYLGGYCGMPQIQNTSVRLVPRTPLRAPPPPPAAALSPAPVYLKNVLHALGGN